MPTNFPSGYDVFPEPTETLLSSGHGNMHRNVQDAVEAIQAELGLNPSGDFATVAARAEAIYDATPVDSGWTDFAWAAGWTVSISRARKYSALGEGGIAIVSVGVTRTGGNVAGTPSTPATLPAGFRPDSLHYLDFWITGQETKAIATVTTDGIITFSALTINTGQSMYLAQTPVFIAGV